MHKPATWTWENDRGQVYTCILICRLTGSGLSLQTGDATSTTSGSAGSSPVHLTEHWEEDVSQHLASISMLVKNDKERLIFDAAKRFTAESVPINMMTSTKLGTELPCLYGTTLRNLLERIYDLRISFVQNSGSKALMDTTTG